MDPFNTFHPSDKDHPFSRFMGLLNNVEEMTGVSGSDMFLKCSLRMLVDVDTPEASCKILQASAKYVKQAEYRVAKILKNPEKMGSEGQPVQGLQDLLTDLNFHALFQSGVVESIQEARRKSGINWNDEIMSTIREADQVSRKARTLCAVLLLGAIEHNVLPPLPYQVKDDILDAADIPESERHLYDGHFTLEDDPDSWS